MKSKDNQTSILAQYAQGPALLETSLAGSGEADLDARGSQVGWTIRQIVHHIVDGDDFWKLCIKSALGNEEGEFTLEWYWALSQDEWAERWEYSRRSVDVSLALFKANRAHVLQLLEQVPDAWQRSIGMRRPDGQTERVSVGTAIEVQARHVVHHTKRIRAIREQHGKA
jgi:uncharacterized damage-inducible protein DinB